MRILIVEDTPDSRLVLKLTLQGAGHEVVEAVHGAEALAKARRQPPDLIISDILMPVMDGFKLCYEVKNDPALARIPFVFYTATYVDPADERLAMNLGASRFLLKPLEPDVFLAAIADVVKEVEAERLAVPAAPLTVPENLFRQYHGSLSRKLDRKVRQLETYQGVFRNSDAAVAILSPDGESLHVNPAWEALLGCVGDGPLRLEPARCLAPEDANALQTAMTEGRPFRGEGVYHCPNGLDLALEVSVFPVKNENDQVSEHVLSLRDVTGRKRAEEERERLLLQLSQAQKLEAVGRLAGGVAHDFNNLLTVINGLAELAVEQLAPGDPLLPKLHGILDAGARAAGLTRQLLAFSRLQVVCPRALDLNAAIAGMEKMLRRLIGEDIALVWKLSAELWPVHLDPSQADQLLANLVVNARDAIAGVGSITVATANVELDAAYCALHPGAAPGEYVQLVVSDTGAGMDAETLAHIFEPFFTTKEPGKGTGLGLATVYGIVKQAGGSVYVYSEPGQGTTVCLNLPRWRGSAEAPVCEPPRPSRGGAETLLLVEDEAEILALGCDLLKSRGYRVLAAGSPDEALAVAAQEPGTIHLLVTDVVLPGMNGRELCERLQALRPQLKCLYLSGYPADVITQRGVLAEGVNFLQKPYSLKGLSEKVRAVLDG